MDMTNRRPLIALLALISAACSSGTPSHHEAKAERSSAPASSANDVVAADTGGLPCKTGDLHVAYRAGGFGTGNDFGTFLIRSRRPGRCSLLGSVLIEPVDGHGRRVSTYAPIKAISPPASLTLSPTSAAALLVAGEERDDPRPPHGLCPRSLYVVPAAWRVFVGGTRLADSVPNHGLGGDSAALFACRGLFTELSLQPA